MLHRFVKKISAMLGISLLLAVSAPAIPVHAGLFDNSVQEACQGTQLNDSGDCDAEAAGRVRSIIRVVLNIFSWIAGIIAVIMIIIGGLKYITSGGDSAGVNSAKNTLLYAVIGLVVVAVAQILVRFVVNKTNV